MAKQTFESVNEYLDAAHEGVRRVLERVRGILRKAVPAGEETIAYNIPTLKLRGKTVLHFAGWKDFVSVYPANSRVAAEFGAEIAPYLFEKSTLRFPVERALPAELIERIAKFRAAEIMSTGGKQPAR
ncbi:MAG TPA: DUF1801 domain-containing protein [Candidatus Nitrosotalea sp.]|nr:DUF1801 domain-containing protein [Candidatus Nitrosotalea sp.]